MRLGDHLKAIIKPGLPDQYREDNTISLIEVDGVKYYYDFNKADFTPRELIIFLDLMGFKGDFAPAGYGFVIRAKLVDPFACTAKPPQKMKSIRR